MIKVIKIYIKEQKYNNINNSFNYKLIIFLDIYNYIKLLKEALIHAFLIILKGLALDYFYNTRLL